MARSAKVDWDAAFSYFAGLGPTRSLPQVARQFGVTVRTVARHASRDNWRQRARDIDAQARARAEEKVIRSRTDRLQDSLRLIDAARVKFARQLTRADYEVKASDFAALLKLEALLEGEATDRIEVGEFEAALRETIEVAFRFIPFEKREQFLDECEASTLQAGEASA